jgi:hypothetical protein
MHSSSAQEYLEDDYKKLGKPVPTLLFYLCGVYSPKIKGKDIYNLLVELSKSHEFYSAHNKPESEWDEYDYMVYPIWIKLGKLLEMTNE